MLEVSSRPVVVVVGAEVRHRVGRAGVLELGVAGVEHGVVELAHEDADVVLVLLAETQLVIFVVKGVLDVTPLLGRVFAVLLKDHSVAVKGPAAVVGAPDDDNPLNVVSVTSILFWFMLAMQHDSSTRSRPERNTPLASSWKVYIPW